MRKCNTRNAGMRVCTSVDIFFYHKTSLQVDRMGRVRLSGRLRLEAAVAYVDHTAGTVFQYEFANIFNWRIYKAMGGILDGRVDTREDLANGMR